MRLRRSLLALAAAVGLASAGTVLALAPPASAHGAMQIPGSRTWLCYEDGLTATGAIVPNNPACAAAVAQSGTTSLYNWFAVLRSDGSGRTQGFIPDGELCSGGAVNYDFSGYDLPRDDWPRTHLTSGATIQIRYNKWAAHPGTFYLYISKPGVDLTQPLSWSDFDMSQPFSTSTMPPSVGSPGSVDSYYYWDATLPAGRSGNAIIYSVWARSDSTETFYGCSDVTFDGGNGQVTGMGPGCCGGGTPPPVSPTPTSSPTSSPTGGPTRSPSSGPSTPPTGGSGCTAAYSVSSSWPGGFQAGVTITARSSIHSWTVTWTFTNGETITQLWNGTNSSAGSSATVTNVSYNGTLSAGQSTSFGFLGSGTAGTVNNLSCTAT